MTDRRHRFELITSDKASLFEEGSTRFLFIQMEYCSGQTLRKAIDSGVPHHKPQLIWILFRQVSPYRLSQ